MALRLRRGTDAQRALITPAEGELIYVTDTNEIYVGDGTTVGGIRITGEVVNELNQLNDVDAALPEDGHVLVYDSPTGDWVSGELPLVDLADVNAVGITDGQVLAWDATAQAFIPANNAFSNNFVGDVIGSVFSDDSTLIINGQTGEIFTANLTINGDIKTFGLDDTLNIENQLNTPGDQSLRITATDGISRLLLTRASASDLTGNQSIQYGGILFERDDVNGPLVTGAIFDGEGALVIQHNSSGYTGVANETVSIANGKLGIGKYVATEALDVIGNAVVSGQVDAASFRGSLVADDSTLIVDAIGGTVTAQGFVQFGSYTTTERNAISAANGMVVYNSTDNRFQGYQNSAWINLDDGTAA